MNQTKIIKVEDTEKWNEIISWAETAKIDTYLKIAPLFNKLLIPYDDIIYVFYKNPSSRRKPHCGAIMNAFKAETKWESKLDKEKFGYKEIPLKDKKRFKVKWDIMTDWGFDYFDEFYVKQPLKCWSYDVNSAFAFAMLKPMPDTSQEPRYKSIVQKGEIGFNKFGGATTEVGIKCDYVFKLTDSPFKSYIIKYYNLKKNATDKELRAKYKDFLNIPTGMMQRKDIFVRNAIIYYSNQYIKSFIDENTVYCNVDCIVSLVPRYDIPIGDEIGQFKNEHICEDFKYIGTGMYQWGNDCHYKGIPAYCIEDIEDTNNWIDNIYYKSDKTGRIFINEKAKKN